MERVDYQLTVSINGRPATVTFVGQGGVARQTAKAVTTSTYALRADDTYVRIVIRTPAMVMYLNPVLRYNGRALPRVDATVDRPLILAKYMLVVLFGITVASHRRGAPQPVVRLASSGERR